MSATRASPLFNTSKPSPFSDFLDGSNNCERYFASFAFRRPKWYSVAARKHLGCSRSVKYNLYLYFSVFWKFLSRFPIFSLRYPFLCIVRRGGFIAGFDLFVAKVRLKIRQKFAGEVLRLKCDSWTTSVADSSFTV